MLVAVLHELDGPPQRHGVQAGEHVLRVDAELQAEAASDVRRHHPDAALVDAQRLRELLADEVWRLGRGEHCQLSRSGPPLREHRAGLHGEPCHSIDEEPALNDNVGLLQPRRDVARTLPVAHQQV